MPSYSRNDLVLVRYPFSDLLGTKVRPAVVVSPPHASRDLLVVPLTSRTDALLEGEFVLADWRGAGLHLPTAVKRGIYTLHDLLVIKAVGTLGDPDAQRLELSIRGWLGLGER